MNIAEKFERDYELAGCCTYRVGGPADWFFDAGSVEELVEAIEWADGEGVKVFVMGAGSNVIFDDAGFRGLVVRFRGGDLKVEGEKIVVDAGVLMPKLVRAAAEAGLAGLEAWSGLPGTVGGAVYGNAGSFGVEVKDVLEKAEVFVPGEGVKEFGVEDFEFDYRSSKLKRGENSVVLRAVFKLKTGDAEEIKANMKEITGKRVGKQPPGASCGSFFKNPVDHPAGWLLDQCGLKGRRVGGAMISEDHANFFLNKESAKASDILELARLAKEAVKEKFGIELEEEVVYVAA
jgi:UDP-N-acetylmuramate dehydrogenase